MLLGQVVFHPGLAHGFSLRPSSFSSPEVLSELESSELEPDWDHYIGPQWFDQL